MALYTENKNSLNISVKANTNSQKERLFVKEDSIYVYFRAAREQGKANEKLIEILSDQLEIPKKFIQVLSGHTSSRKVIAFTDLPHELNLHLKQKLAILQSKTD